MREIALGILTLILATRGYLTKPKKITCPRGFYAEGVKPDGSSRCVKGPPNADAETWDDYSFGIQLHCTGGQIPIIENDGRTIGCQARH